MEGAALEQQAFLQAGFVGAIDRFLDHHHDRQRESGDGCRGREGFFQQLVGGDDARYQSRTLGFLGIDEAGGEAHVHGFGLAHCARQALGAAGAGQDAELDLGLTEFGCVCRIDHVAHHRQFAAAAQRKACHCSDDRLAAAGDAVPVAADVIGFVDIHEIPAGHGADVGAGGEGLLRAGDDHAADVRVGFEFVEGDSNLVDQSVVQGVHCLGPIDRDEADLAAGFNNDIGVTHCAVS